MSTGSIDKSFVVGGWSTRRARGKRKGRRRRLLLLLLRLLVRLWTNLLWQWLWMRVQSGDGSVGAVVDDQPTAGLQLRGGHCDQLAVGALDEDQLRRRRRH